LFAVRYRDVSGESRPGAVLEAAVEDVNAHAIEAFELLSHEARLAILLALREASDPSASTPRCRSRNSPNGSATTAPGT